MSPSVSPYNIPFTDIAAPINKQYIYSKITIVIRFVKEDDYGRRIRSSLKKSLNLSSSAPVLGSSGSRSATPDLSLCR